MTFDASVSSRPEFSPDERLISFVNSTDLFSQDRIMLFERESGNQREVFRLEGSRILSYVWSPDGRYLAVSTQPAQYSLPAQSDIYRLRLSDGQLVNLTPGTGFDRLPSWNRSSERISFLSARDTNAEGSLEVYLMGAGGEDQERLTFDEPGQSLVGWQ